MLRQLIESDTYKKQVAALGGAERMDDVLLAATWALSTSPEVYEVVKGFKDIRLLKTDEIGGASAYRLWFRIDENGQHVHLEAIEAAEQA